MAIAIAVVLAVLLVSGVFGLLISFLMNPLGTAQRFNRAEPKEAIVLPSTLHYTFNVPGTLEETGQMDESSSPYFWLNSGGKLLLEDGFGETIQGELPLFSKWRFAYNLSNPADSDYGAHPQNIFRLVTRSAWQDASTEVYFLITNDNLSSSPSRNESNGLLLMSRYADQDNLYYAGIRVDGSAVVKKKKGGEYYTLAETPLFTAAAAYDRATHPNLLPKETWLGVKCETLNNPDGSVTIRLFLDEDRSDKWKLVIETIDDGERYGGAALKGTGHVGIRTDFMDVQFQNYMVDKV
jgi:hypothetical protein